jgi:small subunit ribosomal protein S16
MSIGGSPLIEAELEYPNPVAVKIKLMRLGKMRAPYYRIVVADSRTKRDGQSIEEIGKYHPKEDPSFIEVKADRAAYWLSVGAQPTEAVTAILKVSGDWQKFKGLPAPPPMLVAKPKADKRIAFEVAAKEGAGTAPTADATTPKSRKAPAKKTADPSSPESSDAAAVAVEAEEADGGIEAITAVQSGGEDSPRAAASVAEEVADASAPETEAPETEAPETEAAATEAAATEAAATEAAATDADAEVPAADATES